MSKTTAGLITFILLAGAVIGFLLWQDDNGFNAQLNPPAPPPVAQAEPDFHYPIEPDIADDAPLPALDASDASFWTALGNLIDTPTLQRLFRPENIVRRIVVTVDNLPREVVADRLRPVHPVAGRMLVDAKGEDLSIAPQNAARYTPYVRVLERVDARKITELYTRFYPLFQSAYKDLGYPNAYFNDRLVAVIDHMLAAPTIDGPIALEQPHILYKYADPRLEASSAGHKLMLRMGSDNAKRVKAKLRDIRSQIAAGAVAR
jgi:hypothetical protein